MPLLPRRSIVASITPTGHTATVRWYYALLLFMLTVLASQFQIGCSQGDCPLFRKAVGAATMPLALGCLATAAWAASGSFKRKR